MSCTDGSADTGGSGQAQVVAAGGDTPHTDPATERHAKQAYREPGSTEERSVDWAEADAHARADASELSPEAQAAIAAAPLPVLIPREAALLTDAVVTRGPTWYAASLHPEGHHVRINGRRLAVHRPSLSDRVPDEARSTEPSVSRTHGIVSVAFARFGASYTLDVECAAPDTDARCTEDAYALSLVQDLGVAGGAR